eukprot:6185808-Pleurochrysis_carterae.AAC.2
MRTSIPCSSFSTHLEMSAGLPSSKSSPLMSETARQLGAAFSRRRTRIPRDRYSTGTTSTSSVAP